MFSVGEKLVFIGCPSIRVHPSCRNNMPKVNEVVTYQSPANCDPKMIRIVEYPHAFDPKYFRKLSDISSELSEEILEKCLTTIEEPIEV